MEGGIEGGAGGAWKVFRSTDKVGENMSLVFGTFCKPYNPPPFSPAMSSSSVIHRAEEFFVPAAAVPAPAAAGGGALGWELLDSDKSSLPMSKQDKGDRCSS